MLKKDFKIFNFFLFKVILPKPPIPPLPPPPIPPIYTLSVVKTIDLTIRQQLYAQFLQFYIFKYSNKNNFKTCHPISLQNLNYLNYNQILSTNIVNNTTTSQIRENKLSNFLSNLTNSNKYLVNNLIIPTSVFFALFLLLLISFIIYKK